ncbi:alveolar macrophage chemotactic factor [Pholidichthys leucotaenia]
MKTLVLLLTALCCCFTALHAFSWHGCRCLKTSSTQIPAQAVKKIEVTPASGHCRKTEILITRRNGLRVCIPPEAPWFPQLLSSLQKENVTSPPQIHSALTHI